MARIRSVKPEFWTDGVMVGLTVWARLFYIGSWNFACDRGHLPDDPMSLKLKILPADPVDVAELIAELIAAGRVDRRATRDGRSYLTIRRFTDHQKLDPRWTSKCPYCAAEAEGGPPPPPPTPLPPEPPRETHPNSGEAQRGSPEPPEPQPRIGRDRSGGDRSGEEQPPHGCAAPEPEPPDDIEPEDPAPLVGELVPVDPPEPGTDIEPANAGLILAAWIDHCRANGVTLPKRLIGQYAKRIKAAIDEGFDELTVKRALASMLDEHVANRPSYLDNHLVRAQTGPERRSRRLTPGEESARTLVDDNPQVVNLIDWALSRDAS